MQSKPTKLAKLVSYRTKKGEQNGKPTLIHGITSLTAAQADPARLLRLPRGHWSVENRAFWERDVVFREDASPATTTNLVAVLACLRGAVLNLIRFHQGKAGVAKTVRRFNANRKQALEALGCS
jgi:predicted transposase YbfD/YdcC